MADLTSSTAKKFILQRETIPLEVGGLTPDHNFTRIYDNPPTDKVNYGRIVAGSLSQIYKESTKIMKISEMRNFKLKFTVTEVLDNGDQNLLIVKEWAPNQNQLVDPKAAEEAANIVTVQPEAEQTVKKMAVEIATHAIDCMGRYMAQLFQDNPEFFAFRWGATRLQPIVCLGVTVSGKETYKILTKMDSPAICPANWLPAYVYTRDGKWLIEKNYIIGDLFEPDNMIEQTQKEIITEIVFRLTGKKYKLDWE